MGIYNRLFESSVLVLIGTVYSAALGLLFWVGLGRLLGASSFGLFSLGYSIVGSLAMVLSLGFPTGLARYLPRADEAESKSDLILLSIGVSLLLTTVVAVGLVVGSPYISLLLNKPELSTVLGFFAVGMIFLTSKKLLLGILRGLRTTVPHVLVNNIVFPTAKILFVLCPLVFVEAVWIAAGAWALSLFAVTIFSLGFVLKEIEIKKIKKINWEYIYFSLPLMLSASVTLAMEYGDILLMGYFLNTNSVGQYNAAYRLATIQLLLLGAFETFFLPEFSALNASGRDAEAEAAYQMTTKWSLVVTTPFFALCLLAPTELISLIYGQGYESVGTALAILSIGFFINVLAGPNTSAITSAGYSRTLFYINVFVSVMNVLLNILLVPLFGVVGGAIATASSYVLLNFVLSYLIHAWLSINPISVRGFVTSAGTIIGGLFAIIVIGTVEPAGFFVVTSLFFILVLGQISLFLLYGFSENDFEIATEIFNKYNIKSDWVLDFLSKFL